MRQRRQRAGTRRGPAPAIDFARWIVWEDEDLVAVDKPAGILSQGGENRDAPNLVDLARAHVGRDDVGVLHRVDRNVSGVVLVAKHPRAARAMARLFREGAVERVYLAIVRGRPPREVFQIDAWLAKDARTREVSARARSEVERLPPAAQRRYRFARTEAAVVRRFQAPIGSCAELSVRPVTGRSHQIRAHLAHAGLPVVGDPKYGVRARGVDRPLLHAARVSFTHPASGARLEIEAPVPWTDALLRGLTGQKSIPRWRGHGRGGPLPRLPRRGR